MTTRFVHHARRQLALATTLFVTSLSGTALADSGGIYVSSVIPYRGVLEFDGFAVEGLRDLRFDLYDDSDVSVWNETHLAVPVVGGRFFVLLGSIAPFTAANLRQNGLSLGVQVDDGSGPIPLLGRQLLAAAPFAWGGAPGQDFDVDGVLRTQGDADVQGTLSVGTGADVGGSLSVTADDLSVATIEARGNGQGTGAIFVGQSTSHGGGMLYNGDDNPDIVGGIERVSFFRRDADLDHEVFSYAHNSPNVEFVGQIHSPTVSGDAVFSNSEHTHKPVGGAETTTPYRTDLDRWLISVAWDPSRNAAVNQVRLDQARLQQMCGDEDGCTIRLGMRNWISGESNQTVASAGPYHFDYSVNSDGTRASFRRAGPLGGSIDGDSVVSHVLVAWNCYFTDAVYTLGTPTNNDGGISMQLVAYRANGTYAPTCELIIDD